MKKSIRNIFLILTVICAVLMLAEPCFANKHEKHLSKSERDSLCEQLKSQSKPTLQGAASLGGGIIPDNVLISIYNTTKKISDKTALLLTLGHALTCHAVHAGKNSVDAGPVTFFDYPDFSVWICGAIVYFVGFMMTLSISFYVADIAFKLGFAVIMLPIGFALWPFPVTKDKIAILISIILKNAAIFAFLAITVTYSLSLLDAALDAKLNDEISDSNPVLAVIFAPIKQAAAEQGLTWDDLGGMEKIFFMITNNVTDIIAKNFTPFSTYFLVIMFAMVYGLKLIGATITDYVDKFFPDKAFGKAAPIHGSMTQGVDFVKKKAVAPIVSYASDVAKTQTGRLVQGTGKLISGKYNKSIKNFVHNPANVTSAVAGVVHGFGGNVAKAATGIVTGTIGRVVMGSEASKDLQQRIGHKIDYTVANLDAKAEGVAQELNDKFHELEKARKDKREARRIQRREKFDNSRMGKAYNAAVAKHAELQERYENRLQELQNQRDDIDYDADHKIEDEIEYRDGMDKYDKEIARKALMKKYGVESMEDAAIPLEEYRKVEGAVKGIELKTNRFIQALNTSRDIVYESEGSEGYKKIDNLVGLQNQKSDAFTTKTLKFMARGYFKMQLAVKNATSSVYNGVDNIKGLKANSNDSAVTKALKSTARTVLKAPLSIVSAATGGAKQIHNEINNIRILKANEKDGTFKKALKSVGRGVLKSPTAIVDGAHRLVTGSIGITFNTYVAARGGITKFGTRAYIGVKTAPNKIGKFFRKVPANIEEGALRAINVTKNIKHVNKAVKGAVRVTGEILDKTGDKMQRNKKSKEQLRREKENREYEEALEEKRREEEAKYSNYSG